MASLQISKSTFIQLNFHGKPSSFFSEADSRKKNREVKFSYGRSRYLMRRRFGICCAVQDDDNKSNGEEPPESLFMKELRRRGMTSSSLLEETNRSNYGLDDEIKVKEDGGFSNRNAVSTELDKSLSNQMERSMALNSEGLEGLVPRAKVLLTIGGTFFLGFWPLILTTVAVFSALYLYFGPTFVHDGSKAPISLPQYIDPYTLLEDERIQIAPPVN